MHYQLVDLIDIPALQKLLDSLDKALSLPSAVIDVQGNVLTATAWQDFCIKFHRAHPVSSEECRVSDLYILNHIHEGNPSVQYQCPQGLVDTATPIIIDGEHLANLFIGQYLLEKPDIEFHRKQAQKYGFDEEAYLEALSRVTVIPEEELKRRLAFVKEFAEFLTDMGLKRLRAIENEKLLERAQSAARLGYWVWDISKDTAFWSDEIYRIFGLNPATTKLSNEFARSLVHPGDVHLHRKMTLAALDGHIVPPFEQRSIRPDGQTVYHEVHGFELERDATGKPIKLHGILVDITKRKESEAALRQSEERYRNVVEDQTEIISRFLPTGELTFVNEIYCRFFLKTKEEMIGKKWFFVAHPDDLEMIKEKLQHISPSNPVVIIENRIISGPGEERWVQFVNRGLYDEDGNLMEVQSVGRDITERRAAEQAKRDLEHSLEEQKRKFYRETIYNVTQGKLDICEHCEAEEFLSRAEYCYDINKAIDVSIARREIERRCETSGITGSRLQDYVVAVGEGITNSLKHAAGGRVFCGTMDAAVWVAVEDRGPGIESLILPSAVFQRGFSTKPSMGLGYSIMLESTDRMLLHTDNSGTTLVLFKNIQPTKASLDSIPDTWESLGLI